MGILFSSCERKKSYKRRRTTPSNASTATNQRKSYTSLNTTDNTTRRRTTASVRNNNNNTVRKRNMKSFFKSCKTTQLANNSSNVQSTYFSANRSLPTNPSNPTITSFYTPITTSTKTIPAVINNLDNDEDYTDLILKSQEQTIAIHKDEIEMLKKKLKVEQFKNISFTAKYKHKYIEITGSGKRATCLENSMCNPHCYMNIKMEQGSIHHFILFMSFYIRPFFVIGATTNDHYVGDSLNKDYTSCDITIWDEHSILLGGNGNKIINQSFNSITAQNNNRYEIVFDMIHKTMSIKQENKEFVYLFRNVNAPLYPFVCLTNKGNSFEIVDYWEE